MRSFVKIYASLAFFICVIAGPLYAKNPIYHYEPDVIEIRGTIERQTFPGRPGYHSIKEGDEPERGWYLRLEEPIDVERSPKDDNPGSETETEKNVGILHLAFGSEKAGKVVRRAVGKKVTLKGYLFHRINGHHHSRVLMNFDEARKSDK